METADSALAWVRQHSALALAGGIALVLLFLHFRAKGKTTAAPTQADAASQMAQAYASEQQSLTGALNDLVSHQQTTTTTTTTPGSTSGSTPPPTTTPPPVTTPPPTTNQPNPPVQTQPHHSVTVQNWPAQDSTLSGIAAHYSVPGGWQALYAMDKSTIDTNAHAHGHFGDEFNWLFPGEVLGLPN